MNTTEALRLARDVLVYFRSISFVNGKNFREADEAIAAIDSLAADADALRLTEPQGWLSAASCSRVADLLHLLKYATITTPSVGDAELAARIMASLRTDGAAKCELASYVAPRAQADEDAVRLDWLARCGDFYAHSVPSDPHDFELEIEHERTFTGENLRECIDAARAQQGDKHD